MSILFSFHFYYIGWFLWKRHQNLDLRVIYFLLYSIFWTEFIWAQCLNSEEDKFIGHIERPRILGATFWLQHFVCLLLYNLLLIFSYFQPFIITLCCWQFNSILCYVGTGNCRNTTSCQKAHRWKWWRFGGEFILFLWIDYKHSFRKKISWFFSS